MGYLPQIQAGIERLLPNPTEQADIELQKQGISQPSQDYIALRDENIRRQQQLLEQNPIAYGAGQLAGSVASSAPMAGVGQASSFGKRLVDAAKVGATQAALYNPGDVEGEYSGLQLKKRLS